jgi:hypothetical protein
VALTATLEPSVEAVRLDLTIPAAKDRLHVWRTSPSSTTADVRGFVAAVVVPGPVILRDFEAPIGVPVTDHAEWWAAPSGTRTADTPVTITIPADGCGDTWLTDLARAGNTQQVVLESLAQLAYAVPSVVHSIIGRRTPIISGDVAHTPTFELLFLTETDADREQARACLGNGVPVLLRTPPDQGIGNLYFAVTGFAEQRIVPTGTVADRRWVVQGVQVDRPDPALYTPLAPVDYLEVKTTFATYAALMAARASYDALAYDWVGSGPSDVVPWPPDDV